MGSENVLILLIEDDASIRYSVRTLLGTDGMLVAEASSARQGMAEIAARKPDLLLLDLGLPDMDGVAVISQLREWSAMPIIVLSARADETHKVAALDAGADDYLTKPFGGAELKARIRAHLRQHVGSIAPIYRFGEIILDLAQRTVHRGPDLVHLTPTEYKLLSTLIRNAGKVLTHNQLLREVWGEGYSDRAHYLRIYMGHLRQKLEADPARPRHITTETGIGYRMIL
ncbi:response regulator [Pseudoduganella sp. OTU4001]|uniref:response regulator n=1 Tax=Pseudoduganella sp. OTU4001 TaxID=3043854 RepID=UPI00313CB05D